MNWGTLAVRSAPGFLVARPWGINPSPGVLWRGVENLVVGTKFVLDLFRKLSPTSPKRVEFWCLALLKVDELHTQVVPFGQRVE